MSRIRFIIGFLLCLLPAAASPAIKRVPGEYQNIQAAIDAALDGDTILIADGIYSGPGNIGLQWDATNKHLVIMSENGRDHCIIDCLGENRGFCLSMGQDHRDVIDGLTITNGNNVTAGGAILIDSTSPRIINCMLLNNYADGDMVFYAGGGAIMINDKSSPVIQGNIIRGNYAGYHGGGIFYSYSASGVLENNIIDNNETHSHGGGIALDHNSNPQIVNNLIINNLSRGHMGGGIYTWISNPSIINNTIAYNSTQIEHTPGLGGGIGIEGEPYPAIRNCIIWGNRSSSYSMNIQFPSMTWMDISYCNVENDLGHIFDLEPHTNIDSLPGFLDPETGDFQLTSSSPCINMGDPDTTGMNLPLLDLAGNQRINEGRVDIGAFEFKRPSSMGPVDPAVDFQLYPNPSNGTFFLIHRGMEKYENPVLRICNLKGAIVLEEGLDLNQVSIPVNIKGQSSGVYILTVQFQGIELYQKKLLIN